MGKVTGIQHKPQPNATGLCFRNPKNTTCFGIEMFRRNRNPLVPSGSNGFLLLGYHHCHLKSLRGIQEPTMDWICTCSSCWPNSGGRQGQGVPSVAACADKLYCKGCFNAWGWYMKSGPNVFRLALDCNLA